MGVVKIFQTSKGYRILLVPDEGPLVDKGIDQLNRRMNLFGNEEERVAYVNWISQRAFAPSKRAGAIATLWCIYHCMRQQVWGLEKAQRLCLAPGFDGRKAMSYR